MFTFSSKLLISESRDWILFIFCSFPYTQSLAPSNYSINGNDNIGLVEKYLENKFYFIEAYSSFHHYCGIMACNFGTPKGNIYRLLGQFTIILSLWTIIANQLRIKINGCMTRMG